MLRFQANIYACPTTVLEGPTRQLRDLSLPTLTGPQGGPPLFVETLPVSFEAMQQQLMQLARCDCEPDGFFLLTGREAGLFWRLSGHMHEYQPEGADEPAMHRIELNGECPESSFDDVLRTMGWPEAELALELVQEGVTMREEDFRRYAHAHSLVDTTRLTANRVVPTPSPTAQQPHHSTFGSTTPAPPSHTTWHITFGTYGTRLHGDARPTVHRQRNQPGMPFEPCNDALRTSIEAKLKGKPVRLSKEQRQFIEQTLPAICDRGGWHLRAAAAQEDHVHVVCDIRSDIHGEEARKWLKRWLGEALTAEWPDPERPGWWAVKGSNKAIHEAAYLKNAVAYVERQSVAQ